VAKLLGALADAQLGFAAANLADIKNRMSAAARQPAGSSSNPADPMKREFLDTADRRYQYDWLAIKNKHDVVLAEAGTHFRWIPACAGMTRFWGMTRF